MVEVDHRPVECVDHANAGFAADQPAGEVVPHAVLVAAEVDEAVGVAIGDCAQVERTRAEGAELRPSGIDGWNGRDDDDRLRQLAAARRLQTPPLTTPRSL